MYPTDYLICISPLAEKLVQELGLEGCRSAVTPATKSTAEQCNSDTPIPDGKVTHFRALAANEAWPGYEGLLQRRFRGEFLDYLKAVSGNYC